MQNETDSGISLWSSSDDMPDGELQADVNDNSHRDSDDSSQ